MSDIDRNGNVLPQIHARIQRIRRIKLWLWLIPVVTAMMIAGHIGNAHSNSAAPLGESDIMLLMGATLFTTLIYLAYIVMHIPIVRAIYDARQRHQQGDSSEPFRWHALLRKNMEQPGSAAGIVAQLAFKAIALFALVLAYQFSWVHGLNRIGEALQTKHYAFMGFIDFALFSVVVLFAVVIVTTRIGSLARKAG